MNYLRARYLAWKKYSRLLRSLIVEPTTPDAVEFYPGLWIKEKNEN